MADFLSASKKLHISHPKLQWLVCYSAALIVQLGIGIWKNLCSFLDLGPTIEMAFCIDRDGGHFYINPFSSQQWPEIDIRILIYKTRHILPTKYPMGSNGSEMSNHNIMTAPTNKKKVYKNKRSQPVSMLDAACKANPWNNSVDGKQGGYSVKLLNTLRAVPKRSNETPNSGNQSTMRRPARNQGYVLVLEADALAWLRFRR